MVFRSAGKEVLEVLSIDGRIILKCIKIDMASVWTGFVWLSTVTG
jgi:hypothetical protein